MFPETQTAPAPTGADDAPSFADIVREQTQGGRVIIQFLVDAMTGELPNFKPCHRVDASGQLIKLQASPFAHIVMEYTDGGRLITQFLLEAITGRLPDFEDCHRMDAERLLAKSYPLMARALTEDNTTRRSSTSPSPLMGESLPRTRYGGRGEGDLSPSPLMGEGWGEGESAPTLDEIVRQETDDGRDMVRFYADVMRGVLTDFKTHERMDAADKLVSLSSDHSPCPDPAAHATAPQPALYDTAAAGPAAETERSWKPEWTHFEYPEDNSYDFSTYGEDEYDRDLYGDKALKHIFGDEETKSVANQAVLDYQVDRVEALRAAVHSEYETCNIYEPCPSCRVPDPPDDDHFGPHVYGYNALVYIYSSKAIARVGYTAAMDHKKRLAYLAAAADARDTVDPDHDPANGPDPPDPPRPRVLAYF